MARTAGWIVFVFAVLVAGLRPAAAQDLAGEWRIRGEAAGESYEGTASIDESGALVWRIVREDGAEEALNGSLEDDEQGFVLLVYYGLRERLRYLFTRSRRIRYRGAFEGEGDVRRVELTSGGRLAGEETWTRVVEPDAEPEPQPQPQPEDDLPGPGELPFPHPDTFQPLPGTDVWHVAFEPTEFREDMRRRGLLSGDAAADAAMTLRLQGLILQHVNEKYRRTRRGEAIPGQSWRISFTARRPRADPQVFPGVSAPQPGVHYSRMEVGGTDGGTHGRVPRNDIGNREREDNSGSEWGVFSGSIEGSDSTLDPPFRAADRPYVDGSYLLGDGDAAQDRRFLRVQEVSADWAYAVASTLAHEVGHSVGTPHTGRTFWGRVVRAGPWLSLMRHKKNAAILSSRDTHFFPENQRRLDQALGLER